MSYSKETLNAIYELGRMYFEMGFFVPAERIFAGLADCDEGVTAARLGLGLLKLERGMFQESLVHFRAALNSNNFPIHAKLGLIAAFVGMQELGRARSLLAELAKEMQNALNVEPDVRTLAEALAQRCEI